MKKSLQLLCLAIALAMIPAAILIAGDLPADSSEFVQKKYAGWNGVLRGWIFSEWDAGGSFNAWLNACAAEFENAHEGVYLEFTQVDEEALRQIHTSGIRRPDLIFFSPGVIEDDAGLIRPDMPADLLPDLRNEAFLPVAMGGYIWAVNRQMQNNVPTRAPDIHLPDEPGRHFSLAQEYMVQQGSDPVPLPDPGIDLGLAVANTKEDTDALDLFINGELSALAVTQKEIARLIRLRESGRGPDWTSLPGGSCALADQLLSCAVADSEPDRRQTAMDFAAYLCTRDCQQKLSSIAAFPVIRLDIYPAHSPYAALASMLQNLPLLTPDSISEYSDRNSADIVREFKNPLPDDMQPGLEKNWGAEG